jgi:hypothetical protein
MSRLILKKYRVSIAAMHEMELYAQDPEDAQEQAKKLCRSLTDCCIDSVEEIE